MTSERTRLRVRATIGKNFRRLALAGTSIFHARHGGRCGCPATDGALRVSAFRSERPSSLVANLALIQPQRQQRQQDGEIEDKVPGEAQVFAGMPEAAAADIEAERLGGDGRPDEDQ